MITDDDNDDTHRQAGAREGERESVGCLVHELAQIWPPKFTVAWPNRRRSMAWWMGWSPTCDGLVAGVREGEIKRLWGVRIEELAVRHERVCEAWERHVTMRLWETKTCDQKFIKFSKITLFFCDQKSIFEWSQSQFRFFSRKQLVSTFKIKEKIFSSFYILKIMTNFIVVWELVTKCDRISHYCTFGQKLLTIFYLS